MDTQRFTHLLWEELFNRRRLEVAEELFASDYRNHAAAAEDGPEGMKRLVSELTDAFPDHHTRVDGVLDDASTIAMRVTFTGTHNGVFRGLRPTGRSFSQTQMHWVLRNDVGMATDHWAVRDDLGMMTQLGLLPQTAPS